jgi:hypothetical protein
MSGWRSEIRKVLIHPDPQYIVSAVTWVILIVVFAAIVVVRLLSR